MTPDSERGATHQVDRRMVLAGGGISLMSAAILKRATSAQEATPIPMGSPVAVDGGVTGSYAVIREYVVAEGADVAALIEIVEGFVEIVSAVPGFLNYMIVYDPVTRAYVSIGVFDNAESAEASNDAAADFVAEHSLGDYFENPTPDRTNGEIVISAGF